MAKPSRPLHFVYSDLHKSTGSTVMRGFQLARIAMSALPERPVFVTALGTFIRGADVFLTKGAVKRMTMPILESLGSNDNVIYADLVDEVAPAFVAEYTDVVVASSLSAFVDLQRQFPRKRVALVNHHVDPRIDPMSADSGATTALTGYFGEPVNTIMNPAIAERVTVVPVDTSSESPQWIERLHAFNVHYAVRASRDLDHHKPFLKGFTAAHVGAVVVVSAAEREALQWLGPDYPFLVPAPCREKDILTILERVSDSVGSEEWQYARRIMRDVSERTTAERIGAELRSALTT